MTLEDLTIRVPVGLLLNGVNAYQIARLTLKGNVVIDAGPGQQAQPMAWDKYAIKFPSFNSVPPGEVDCLTIFSFKRGVKAYRANARQKSLCCQLRLPCVGGLRALLCSIPELLTFSTSAFSTLVGGYIKVGAVAVDQGAFLLDDPSNLLNGEIGYTRGTGVMGIRGGAGVVVRNLASRTENTAQASVLKGSLTYGTPIWAPRGKRRAVTTPPPWGQMAKR